MTSDSLIGTLQTVQGSFHTRHDQDKAACHWMHGVTLQVTFKSLDIDGVCIAKSKSFFCIE